jgi:uncharacterized protein with GYD domain
LPDGPQDTDRERREVPGLAPARCELGAALPSVLAVHRPDLNRAGGGLLSAVLSKENAMATYIALATFTDQGLRTAKDSVKRADAASEIASRFGVQMKNIHWTLGAYDLVLEFDAKDETSMVAYALAIGAAGNVRFQSMRALDRDEMSRVVQKMP